MKILFAADGSKFTKKAMAFLVTHEGLYSADGEIFVLNVQPPMPPQVKSMVGSNTVADYYRDESGKVLDPIGRFLERHGLKHKLASSVGNAADEIVKAARRNKCEVIVMGTQGHGLLGRALMGSVAQRVVTESDLPVLLVK
ncbi:MAG: universal stress protein [Burkholderiales bacterium]|nr:universal stress protein [Burkholderiales bacterium]